MSKKVLKILFTFKIYTDGKCNNPVKDIPEITSKYFEPELYEFIKTDGYKGSIQRVFDYDKEGINEFISLCKCLRDNLVRSRYESTIEFFDSIVVSAQNLIETNQEQWDFLDSNVEVEYGMQLIQTSARKIKEIIYED